MTCKTSLKCRHDEKMSAPRRSCTTELNVATAQEFIRCQSAQPRPVESRRSHWDGVGKGGIASVGGGRSGVVDAGAGVGLGSACGAIGAGSGGGVTGVETAGATGSSFGACTFSAAGATLGSGTPSSALGCSGICAVFFTSCGRNKSTNAKYRS